MLINKADGNKESFDVSILKFLARFPNESFKSKELSRRIGIRTNKDYQAFKKSLRQLQDQLKIMRIRGKKYGHLHEEKLILGTMELTDRGQGIVMVEGTEEKILVLREDMGEALQGDTVEVSVRVQSTKQIERGALPHGRVIKVVTRGKRTVIGRLERMRRQYYVVPDDRRLSGEIEVAANSLHGAKENDKVVVKLTGSSGNRGRPVGCVEEVIGRSGELSTEIQAVACEYRLTKSFSGDVAAEVNAIPDTIARPEIQRRRDLRPIMCFTIDPEDAKDFDDAVSLETIEDGWYRLGVHIADVSYYVREGSRIDKEALKRGTSVYFPNGVIPMLPEKLSNGLCSLRPDEDRLAFSVLMTVSASGTVKDYSIVESVIRSRRRFSYEDVQEILDKKEKGEEVSSVDEPFADVLHKMKILSSILTRKRMKNGSIDFDSAEIKFRFDDSGKPVEIQKKVRLESHRLVEEFMLLANCMVARHIGAEKKEGHAKPFLYRIHESPDPDRISELAAFVEKMGYKLNTDGGVTSKSLQKLLREVKGTEVENVINEVALRSMAKAIYSERNIGHYGLAFDYYAHFTSPIRRYPDLAVHRMLKKYSEGISNDERDSLRRSLPFIAKQSSATERLALEAERAAVKVMQVEYMKRHIGDEFHGVISGATHYGMFVELTDTLVEGMIHVRDMDDDYYVYDEKQYTLKGRRTGQKYRLGDSVQVKVIRVNAEEHLIDFALLNDSRKADYGKVKRRHTR